MLKIHATRVPAPTPGHDTATKWQVAVTDDNDNVQTFDRVQIVGDSIMEAFSDSQAAPHVYLAPHYDAHVVGWNDDKFEVLQ